jgi:hypothetical protein
MQASFHLSSIKSRTVQGKHLKKRNIQTNPKCGTVYKNNFARSAILFKEMKEIAITKSNE